MCAALTALALAFSPALLAGDWITFGASQLASQPSPCFH